MRKVLAAIAFTSAVLLTTSCGALNPTDTGSTDVFTIVREDEPNSLDPKISTATAQTFIGVNVTESLVQIDPVTGETAPLLAESWTWDGANEWIVSLRQGVSFHDGSPFNADAVVANIERIMDPAEESTLTGVVSNLQSVTATDEYTVEMITAEPDPIFLRKTIAINYVAPTFADHDDEYFATNPIGTGPYILSDWNRGQSIDLEANEDYWDGAPSLKKIHVEFRAESSVRAAMVAAGEAQVATNLAPSDVASVPETIQQTTADVIGVRVDMKGPAEKDILKDVRLRMAMLYAIDMKTLTETVLDGVATPALGAQMIPPGSVGYNDTLKPWPYDPEKAKELIGELVADGFDPTIPIDLNYKGGMFPRQDEVIEVLLDSWSKAGLTNIVPTPSEGQAWIDGIYAIEPGVDHFDLTLSPSSTDVFDMGAFSPKYLECDGFASLSCDAKADELTKAAAQLQGEERDEAYQELADYLQEVVPFLGLASRVALHGTVEGIEWSPRPGSNIYFKEITWTP